jgi:hypothetical protein
MTSEQEINNARQGKNDAQQGRNNAEQVGQNLAQDITNDAQHDTNEVQAGTNAAQADTNHAQASTNSGVQEQIKSIRATSTSVQDVVLALTESLRVNTASLLAVSDDLKSNLTMYRQIDVRFTKVESYAEKIEAMSNQRAKAFRRLWKLAIGIAIALSLLLSSAFYFVSATAANRACRDRNDSQARVTDLIQQFYDIGQSQPSGNGAVGAVEKKYLDNAPAPVNCGLIP